MADEWMIYGANGYTGALIAREAVARGQAPVLAGRREGPVAALAAELGLEHRAFDLTDAATVDEGLTGIGLVLHCAGPFSATSAPMIEGCLRAGAHYLDITGEIEVFEHAHSLDGRAREAGVVVCPGVGFDVIPTDCTAAALARALPDATHLRLGFDSGEGTLSPGTAKTMVELFGRGGKARIAGRIVTVPQAWKRRRIDFGNGEKWAMTLPWGDVSTAFHSTGIPNVEVYVPVPGPLVRVLRAASPLSGIGNRPGVQRLLKRGVERFVHGPDEATRDRTPSWVWGEAVNAAGERRVARVRTANGYALTITGALAVVGFVRAGTSASGYQTPSSLIGPELVTGLPGSSELVIS